MSSSSSPTESEFTSDGAVRAYLAIGVGLILSASAVKQHITPAFVNPDAARWALAGFGGLLLAWSLKGRLPGRTGRRLVYAFAVASIVWVASLLVLNRFDPDAAMGFFMVVMGTGAAFATLFERLAATVSFMGFALVAAVGAGLMTSDPVYSPVMFVGYVAATAAVLLVSTRVQKRLTSSLRETRRLYAGAEAAGGIGSWSADVASGETWWSDGLCALVGAPPLGGSPAPRLRTVIHPDDVDRAITIRDVVARGDVDEHAFAVRFLAADGTERPVRGVLRAERDADGAVVRVAGVVTDVTELIAHEAELVDARDRAEAAARLKAAILANMSHELRTPLTAVIGFAEILAEEADPDSRSLVEPILTGGQRLLDTLNSVLDLARLEADGDALEVWPVDLRAAAAAACAVYSDTAALSGLELCFDGPDTPVPALADAPALGRVLDNLLSNAIRFTDVGGVTLRAYSTSGRAVLEVADTGRGMSEAFRPHAFEAFVQESDGDARSHEGSGLGLTIVHRLVAAMGGDLTMNSTLGLGTRVYVSLPATDIAALAAPREEPVWVARRRLAPLLTEPPAEV